nr:peroxisomal N(1)-acetyl-spermine/spermidine oxidase-like isoform X1 [Paramormyrops kingsleyae]
MYDVTTKWKYNVFGMKKVPRIVVVGAGIAGIGAASELRDAGFSDVTILEATGEIGGRIGKYQLGKAWIDTGAQYIHGTSETNPVYCLSKKFGILDNVPKEEGRWSILSEKGSRVDEDFAERVYGAGEMLIRKRYQDHQRSIGEHFVEEVQKLTANWEASTEEKRLMDGILSMVGKDLLIDTGASDLKSVSLGSWKYFHADTDGDLNIEGNMFDLPSKLLKEFPDESLLLKKPVRKIEWDGSFRTGNGEQHPVRVEFGDEEEILADHVVVTISLGCLKAQASTLFSPQLPEHKLQAIDCVRFGTLTKIFLVYEEAFWDDDVSEISLLWEDESPVSLDADPAQWVKHLHFFSVMKPKEKFGNVLIGWCAGRVGELTETMKEEDLLAAITEHLRAFTRNPSLPPPKSMFRTQWYSNPFTRGAYTYLPVGTDAEVMDTLALPLSGTKATKPDLQLLFAGEATMKSLYSTVQGALLSGQREAQRLAQHYGKVASPASHCSLSPQHQGEPLQPQTVL